MFPVAEPQREQVLWEEKDSWFLEDWKHGLQKGLEGDEIMQVHTALMGKSEGRGGAQETKKRETTCLFSQQIFNECLLHTRHSSRRHGKDGNGQHPGPWGDEHSTRINK